MTRERIKDFREIVLPFLKKYLLKVNYENLGKSDAEEFEKDFNEILDLSEKALDQESVLDKIRAEIEKLQTYKMFVGEKTVYIERNDVLAIIDKYKEESEGTDAGSN